MLLRNILRDEAANFPTVGWKSVQMPHPLPVFYFFGSRSIFRAAKIKIPFPRSFLAPKPHGIACYASYAAEYLKDHRFSR